MNVSKPSLLISQISDGELPPRYSSSIGPDSFQCILSYRHLSKELQTTVRVEAVILSDVTNMQIGKTIVDMTYNAYDYKEAHSLFRSKFKVVYNLNGYLQENVTNCWSLGCVYTDA